MSLEIKIAILIILIILIAVKIITNHKLRNIDGFGGMTDKASMEKEKKSGK